MRGPAFFAYADNYLIDVKFGVIMDVEASRAIRQAEVGAAKTMIDRTEERFGLKPERLAADTAYGSAPTLSWLINERNIAPHTGPCKCGALSFGPSQSQSPDQGANKKEIEQTILLEYRARANDGKFIPHPLLHRAS
jgi:hypothetical protein